MNPIGPASMVLGDRTVDATRAAEGASSGDDARLAEAARAFESIFLQQMFQEMRRAMNATTDGGLGMEFYQGMLDRTVAESASERGGIGLADVLVESWDRSGLATPSDSAGTAAIALSEADRAALRDRARSVQAPSNTAGEPPEPVAGEVP